MVRQVKNFRLVVQKTYDAKTTEFTKRALIQPDACQRELGRLHISESVPGPFENLASQRGGIDKRYGFERA